MAESMRVDFDSSGADAALDALLAASQKAVRPAAQAGAEVMYQEARIRCPVSGEGHWFHGSSFRKTGQKYWIEPGTLRDAIYQVFSKDNSSAFGGGYRNATYQVAWNHKKAPHGFMVEFGTSRAAAHPFLRPAYDATVRAALDAGRRVYADNMRAAGVQ